MNVSLIGPSGAGKGTHTARLVNEFNLLHLCTGDLFREHLERHTALGIIARRYMAQGEMVPDEVVDAMIEERVRQTAPVQGILFDGFPRTAYQARFLDDLFRQLGRQLDAVVYIEVSDEEVLTRLGGREVCRECNASFRRIYHPFIECPRHTCHGEHLSRRADDIPQVARARLRAFHRVTGPVLEHYQRDRRVALIDGERPVEEVGVTLVELFKGIQNGAFTPATFAEMGGLFARVAKPAAVLRTATAMDLLLIGAPGSGKGTQAVTLAKELRLPHIATGDLFRDNLKRQTDLGKLAKTYMDRGELVPDDVTDAMVQERLSRPDVRDGFILDGFPRTLHQAEALAEILAEVHRHVAGAIYLHVPDEEIVERLSGRWICRGCQAPYHLKFKPPVKAGCCDQCGGDLYQRDDDKPATVLARLKTFHAQTEPVIRFYREAGLLHEVNAAGDLSEVTKRVLAAARSVEKILNSPPASVDTTNGRTENRWSSEQVPAGV